MINWNVIITRVAVILMATGLVLHFQDPRFLWVLAILIFTE